LFVVLALIAATNAPVRYFYCRMAERTHAMPCCGSESPTHSAIASAAHADVTDRAPGIGQPAPACCEEGRSGTLTASFLVPWLFELGVRWATAPRVLPSHWAEPAGALLEPSSWPIRAGPASAVQYLILLQVLLN
jgi:hypothetical protein